MMNKKFYSVASGIQSIKFLQPGNDEAMGNLLVLRLIRLVKTCRLLRLNHGSYYLYPLKIPVRTYVRSNV